MDEDELVNKAISLIHSLIKENKELKKEIKDLRVDKIKLEKKISRLRIMNTDKEGGES